LDRGFDGSSLECICVDQGKYLSVKNIGHENGEAWIKSLNGLERLALPLYMGIRLPFIGKSCGDTT
jgi:hypothetical protein